MSDAGININLLIYKGLQIICKERLSMRQLKKDVIEVGARDWDRRLFDELIPLPDGTSYNAYVVKGSKKTALLDTVDPPKVDKLIQNLLKAGVDKIDYVISHHAEQDHSGSIPDILTLHPEAKVVTSPKCKSMLMDLLHIDEDKFIEVEDGETVSLGNKTLRFLYIPWVHWPETIGAYLEEDNILFPCDFFGSHLATSNLFVEDKPRVYEAAKRYYAEIMMPFRLPIRKNLEKISDLEIDMIATSHGPIYDEPEFIIDAYKDWVSDDVKNEVLVPYISMHDSTRSMVDYFVDTLAEKGMKPIPFNLTVTDIGRLAVSMVDAATMVIGSPTVLGGAHPKVAYAAYLANALRPKTKFLSIIGSFGWGSRMIEQLKEMVPHLRVDLIEPVQIKGLPEPEEYAKLDDLADKIAEKHKEIGIL